MDRSRQTDLHEEDDLIDENISTLNEDAERAALLSAPAESIANQKEYVDEP